jgi:dTDP-4-dehydrorhamnose reductase
MRTHAAPIHSFTHSLIKHCGGAAAVRVVVLGSGGRLGAALVREWRALGDEVLGFDRAALDLAGGPGIWKKVEAVEFDVLVNCAALTNVDYCETHAEEAFRVNAEAVGEMAALCARKGRRCIHISTDYVFDGAKVGPYVEEDPPGPLGVYAASKLAGEEQLLAAWNRHLAVRVSWVFGPDRPSFVDQILARARTSAEVAAVADKWAVPTYTLDAARLLRPFLREVPEGGVLHLCNAGSCTWQEYGQFALDCAARAGESLLARTVAPQRMAEIKAFVARRPVRTVLSTEKLTRRCGLRPRPWQEAVEESVGKGARV